MNNQLFDIEYQKKRLAALERYRILDTEAEKAFDDLALLTARLCRVPMSVVSFIDDTRQWYKSKIGCEVTEVPIESTFCQYAIAKPDEVLAVSDATLDSRFKDNAAVTCEPGIRYYLGAPIVSPDGYAIGTVCAIDYVPHTIDQRDLNAISALARQVLSQLELRIHILDLEKHAENEQIIQKALRDTAKAKSFFLANMSHEIRTPLTSIIGFSEMLKDKVLSEKESDEAVQSIYRNGSHLLQLINDILDFSKIEYGQTQIELIDFPISSLIADIESFVGNRAQEKKIAFKILVAHGVPAIMHSDLTRLKQILFNLVGNAIKFTAAGSVTLTIEKSLEGGFTFSVADTGIGIKEDALAKLFQPFTQAEESTTREYGGTGLGLAISKKLIDLMSGTLKVQSRQYSGSCFQFTIPSSFCRKGEEAADTTQLNQKDEYSENKILKVLIAEDVEENRFLLNAIFKRAGINPTFAHNGVEAVQKALSDDFDLIFMDIQMPVLDGIDATRKLISAGFTKPIVALTATAQDNLSQELFNQGFSGYLSKPFNKKDLADILNKFASF